MGWYKKRITELNDILEQSLLIAREISDEQEFKIENLPENLKNGEKFIYLIERADFLNETVQELEDIIEKLKREV